MATLFCATAANEASRTGWQCLLKSLAPVLPPIKSASDPSLSSGDKDGSNVTACPAYTLSLAVLCNVRPPDSSGAFTATPFGDVDGPWRASKARAKHSFAGLQATRTENGPTTPPPTRHLKGSEALPLFAMHTPVAQLPPQELLDPSILIRLPHKPNAGNPDRNALLALKKLAPGAI